MAYTLKVWYGKTPVKSFEIEGYRHYIDEVLGQLDWEQIASIIQELLKISNVFDASLIRFSIELDLNFKDLLGD
jgi:hypothetical protein